MGGREVIRIQRLPGREAFFDLFRQMMEKVRRDKDVARQNTLHSSRQQADGGVDSCRMQSTTR